MAYCTGRCMCHGMLRGAFEADDVAGMVHRLFEGRVEFHDGDCELAPGITLHKLGGHTKGLQVARVNTKRAGRWCWRPTPPTSTPTWSATIPSRCWWTSTTIWRG